MRILKIIAGVILILTAVLCFANIGATFIYIAFILGCAQLFSGIIGILAYIMISRKKEPSSLLLAEGILSTIMGFLVLSNLLITEEVIPMFFGMWVMFAGIQRVSFSDKMRKNDVAVWKWIFFQGLFSTLAGTYAFINPVLFNFPVLMLVGIYFIIQGVNVLTTGINIKLYNIEQKRTIDDRMK